MNFLISRNVLQKNQRNFQIEKSLRSFFAILIVGIFLAFPSRCLSASVNYTNDYRNTYRDVIGNPGMLDGASGYGGVNNLAYHANNIYSYGNTVIISGGTVDSGIYGGFYNGTLTDIDVSSSNNIVTIESSFIGNSNVNVYGGYARNVNPGSMSASNNTLNIYGSMLHYVYGGYAYEGSMTGTGTATASGNVINISGGTANSVYGGYACSEYLGGTHAASGNTINVSGGTIGDIYGGMVSASHGIGQSTNNVVTISGSPDLTNSNLSGGYLGASTSGDAFTGNTLNIKTSSLTVASLRNFQYLNFYLPSTLPAGDTVLTVTGTADLTNGSGRSSTVNVGINGNASPLVMGDTITLIDAGTLVASSGLNTTANGKGMQGVTLLYNFDISTNGNKLLATVSANKGVTVNAQTKALSEGFVSGMGMVTQGADVAAGQGMSSAVSAAKGGSSAKGEAAGGGATPAGFSAASGGSVRYNTGSHVDMRSYSLMAGLVWGTDMAPGRLTFGPFLEYGNGSYNTHNSFSNAASVEGNGSNSYLGGGILGRMDFINTGPGHVYVEASARMGSLRNKYESSDLRDSTGRSAEYDSTSTYYGLHFGGGYVWNITENASLDMSGKYFWTRQNGDSVTLSTGDPIDFKDVDSNRLRLGSRFSYSLNDYISPYVGAAYEREFDGKARASTNGYDMKAPSMRGDTGIGEVGLVYTPSALLPLSFDFGVQGYVDKREGLTGSLQAKYEF